MLGTLRRRTAATGLIEHERTGLREPQKDLPHEKRVTVGLGRDLPGELDPVRFQLVARDGGHDLCHLVRAEAMQTDPLHS